ncbi:MAG: hypothetical protein IH597_08230 [Bacteroidales bacterium]|nr:hypothetical protein [Bacteroidales bacterium]
MKTKRLILFLMLMTLSLTMMGQVKYEQEKRISEKDVPKRARKWLKDAFEDIRTAKWYFETTPAVNSYEAKFRWESHDYSVKFDTSGLIVDVEKKIELSEMPKSTSLVILSYFDDHFQTYKIQKIQEQATGDEDDLEDFIDENEEEGITIRYEIEFHGVTHEENKLWEMLFSSEGELIMQREIYLSPNFNFDF